ncbi:MAG: hypothetical protein C4K49_03560 [Candidatus Thorarchaeota archaeon]|nr:MAG: hypothetical protein C4K49_03560 [Candidatus Thorarchaeota archaeon]
MNIIYKGKRTGTVNEIRKILRTPRKAESLVFNLTKMPHETTSGLLIVCGEVGKESAALYKAKAGEIGADFIVGGSEAWPSTMKGIRKVFDPSRHQAILLIGSATELPSTSITHKGSSSYTDWFIQDADGDGIPDVPVGRIFGPPRTVMYHMDPMIIDSNIAVVFDSQPGRSNRHVQALAKLGFDVEVLEKFTPQDLKLMCVCEFILQFSDGVYTSRIHGTPEMWASHNSMILSYEQAAQINFEGYPFIYSEACCTAREGPLLKAFLNQGACYLGATMDTMNNIKPFDDWPDCAYCDGYKFGLLDLLDSYDRLGQVKLQVERVLLEHLNPNAQREIESVGKSQSSDIESENALSVIEWVFFGNPMRYTTVGPNADYTPGKLIVDT